MARYTDASVDRVKDAVNIVDLVGAKTELRRSGPNSFQALCPFHEERTPSFSVDAGRNLYHCFGCSAGGDGIKFVRETEGVDFIGAIELLADRYGIELEVADEDPQAAQRRKRRERLLELLDRTASFYERVLWESKEASGAREYLLGRGLSEEALRTYRVGFAPSAWDTVLMRSQKAGYSARELYDVGLVKRGKDGGRVFDQFRSRITFPLADMRGRVIGFGARQMHEGRPPKYLNTPENELFHKGRIVYGAHLARPLAAKQGAVIVAEGYTDVIALAQAGFANAVCIMGTSMTEDQVRALRRLAPVAHLALDADNAGQEAMLRAARVAAGEDLELRVLPLPVGLDPADLVGQQGADAVRALVDKSMPFVRFRVQRALASGDVVSAEGKDAVLDELRPVFADLRPSVLREELLRLVADRLDLTPDLAGRLLSQPVQRRREAASSPPSRREAAPAPAREAAGDPGPEGPPRFTSAGGGGGGRRGDAGSDLAAILAREEEVERRFLAFCVALPQAGAEALAKIDPDEHFTAPRTRRAAVHLRDHLDDPTAGVDEGDEELAALMTELTVRAAAEPASSATLDAQRLQLELRRIDRRMAAAAASGEGGATDLAARRREVQAELGRAVERAMNTA